MARTKGVTVTEKGRGKSPGAPYVAGLVCAVNIALDPQQRLSAHAIFSQIQAPALPFHFPQPIYVVATLRGLRDGDRKVALRPEPGVLAFATEDNEGPVVVEHGLAVMAFAVVRCVVHQAGSQYITVTVDGEPLEPVFAFEVVREEQNESTE